MQFTLLLAFAYGIIHPLLAGVSVGAGFLLHWLFPSIDLGTAMLFGAATSLGSAYFFTKAINGINSAWEEVHGENAPSELAEDEFVVIPPPFSRRRRRRKSKQR